MENGAQGTVQIICGLPNTGKSNKMDVTIVRGGRQAADAHYLHMIFTSVA